MAPPADSSPSPEAGNLVVAEAIAAKDLNNLYLTSLYFEDQARYDAFCALYAVMRVVDDRIDAIPSRSGLTAAQRQREHAVLDAWRRLVAAGYQGRPPDAATLAAAEAPSAAPLAEVFAAAVRRFPVPQSLWSHFFDAMARDVERPRFATYQEFLDYAEGATVAPTTIYLYLIAAQRGADGTYRLPPGFDLLACGRRLGVFAYLGHILRDLADDWRTGDEGLLYLAGDDMARHGLTEAELEHDVAAGRAGSALRALTTELVARSRRELAAGRALTEPLAGLLTPDRAFVLELICSIYERLLDKIEARGLDPLIESPRLSLVEKTRVALDAARRVGYEGELKTPAPPPSRSPG